MKGKLQTLLESGGSEAARWYLAQLLQGGDKVVVTHEGQGTEHVDRLTERQREVKTKRLNP